MKALYLDGRGELEVRLDGPALRVRRPGRADGQFPLPRVSRVIAVGRVHWKPEALKACLLQEKPVAILDNQGRFVRVLFKSTVPQFGLARHLGGLLKVARFRERYQRWFLAAERREMQRVGERFAVDGRILRPGHAWQLVCLTQHHRSQIRVGRCYRYLIGLLTAQIASALVLTGMPRRPPVWEEQEYRLFCDMIRLERWRLVVLLEELLQTGTGFPERWRLAAAFEEASEEREQRISSCRRRALLEMMGLRASSRKQAIFERCDPQERPLRAARELAQLCQSIYRRAGRRSRVPFRPRRTLSDNLGVLRDYLDFDRRKHESHRTA